MSKVSPLRQQTEWGRHLDVEDVVKSKGLVTNVHVLRNMGVLHQVHSIWAAGGPAR